MGFPKTSPNSLSIILDRTPAIHMVIVEVIDALEDPNVSLEDISDLLCHDVLLSARSLAMARSPMFSLRRPPETVRDAVRTLGYTRIKDLVITVGVSSALGGKDQCAATQELWEHSLACAVTAGELAARSAGAGTGAEYLCGLLHDIGRFLFISWHGEEYLKLGSDYDGSILAVERDLFGLDHMDLGAMVLRKWNMPEALIDVVRNHHNIDVRSADTGLTSRILYVAEKIAAHCVEDEELVLEETALDCLGLRADEVAGIVSESQAAMAASLYLLGSDS